MNWHILVCLLGLLLLNKATAYTTGKHPCSTDQLTCNNISAGTSMFTSICDDYKPSRGQTYYYNISSCNGNDSFTWCLTPSTTLQCINDATGNGSVDSSFKLATFNSDPYVGYLSLYVTCNNPAIACNLTTIMSYDNPKIPLDLNPIVAILIVIGCGTGGILGFAFAIFKCRYSKNEYTRIELLWMFFCNRCKPQNHV